MPKRHPRGRVAAAGIAGGVGLNALALFALVLGGHRQDGAATPVPPPVFQVTLERPTAPSRPVPRKASRRSDAAATGAVRSAAPASSLAAAPVRPIASPAPAPPAERPQAQDGSIEAARAVLRRLRDCARWSERGAGRPDCGAAGGTSGPAASALFEERRPAFDAAANRRRDLLDTNADLQRGLLDTRGNAARFGCAYSGGKWRCGSY